MPWEIRGQLVRVGSQLLLCWFLEPNSGLQTWQPVPQLLSHLGPISSLFNLFQMQKKLREETLFLLAAGFIKGSAENLSLCLIELLLPYSVRPLHLTTIRDGLKTGDFFLAMRNLPGLVFTPHRCQICLSLCLIMILATDLKTSAFSSAKWEQI